MLNTVSPISAAVTAISNRLESAPAPAPVAVAAIVMAPLPPSALAIHQEAAAFFAAGGTIHTAAANYAAAADTFFARCIVWIVANGFNRLPSNEKGKMPRVEQMSQISSDSKNAARQYAQMILAAAWTLTVIKEKDVFEFASLRAMKAAISAKDKTIGNELNGADITGAADDASPAADDASPAADDASPAKLEIAGPDLEQLINAADMLEKVKAMLSSKSANIAALRDLLGVTAPASAKKTGTK